MAPVYPKFVHPDHPQLFVQPILASWPSNGAPKIITLHGRYPRIIHSEVMTHRKKSKNARSSRAVPTLTMLNEVRTIPFVPWHWGRNQKGMQAGEDCNEPIELFDARHDVGNYWVNREDGWLTARDRAADIAEAYMDAGYHKQIPNRLLEPFAWIDTLFTSTSWANFLHLRDHKDAEPHLQDFARLVGAALKWINDRNGQGFQSLDPGNWHLPYVEADDVRQAVDYLRNRVSIMPTDERITEILKKISAARCARISYKPFDGDASFEREIERFNHLVSSDRIHASPTEHQATPDEGIQHGFNTNWMHPGLGGNLGPGWIQFRKQIPGEYVAD